MKKALFGLVLGLFALAFVFADNPDMYVRSVDIVRIFPSTDGYVIKYRLSNTLLETCYIPMAWFDPAVGKAQLITGSDPTYPYFSVFWQDGSFKFVRIYVKTDPNDPSWGTLPPGTDIQGKFNITAPDFKWQ